MFDDVAGGGRGRQSHDMQSRYRCARLRASPRQEWRLLPFVQLDH
jgi:hypothetical protein